MGKILGALSLTAMLFVLLMVAGSVQTFGWLHELVRANLREITGSDPTVSWLVALGIFFLIGLLPWRSLLLAPLTGSPNTLITLAAICFGGAAVIVRINARVPLDEHGNPKPNRYFNRIGESKVWFPIGRCDTRDRDGFDELGRKYERGTREKIEYCQKLSAEEDRRRKQQAETQEQRQRREQQTARRRHFQELGRYVAVGRFVTIDGIRFSFLECLVLKRETCIKFRIDNLRSEQASTYTNARPEFGLINKEGSQSLPSALRRVEGAVAVAADGSLVPPGPGEHGVIVVEFARDNESGISVITINHAVAFGSPGGHKLRFRPL